MNVRSFSVLPCVGVLLCAALLVGGCARTTRETVFSSGTLKVVAVTESRLDINVSKYQHYTTYELYVDGRKLSDKAFSTLLQDPDATDDQFVHADAVVLDEGAILMASHNRDSSRCWTTRLSASGGRATLETILQGTVDCGIRPAPAGWRALYDDRSDLILIREHPFQVHPMAGYWYVLWIDGDIAALYQKDRDHERLVVKLARISSDTTLAEQALPMHTYAEPDLLHASPELRRQWLFDSFTVSMGDAPSIQLRPDHQLDTITPEVWAEYQENDRQNKALDADARAAGDAWIEAQRRELMDADAKRDLPKKP
ncbi:hypothetical protein ACIGEO_04385 [Stenotrophomonas bentonitica]|uniref:hypothetical protein n=1 Tax=Stenotrophomonas bentonitica TaxID=1450134 RepID=UPI0037CCD950